MNQLLALSPLLLLTLVVWFVARRISKKADPERGGPNGETPYGVRGWLAFFVYASVSLSPFFSISNVNQNLTNAEAKYPSLLLMDGWGSYKLATWVATLIVVGWQIWVAFQLKNKFVARSVSHVLVLLLARPLLIFLADAFSGFFFLGVSAGEDNIIGLISSWLIAAVWVAYFYKSNRVRNTYNIRPNFISALSTS